MYSDNITYPTTPFKRWEANKKAIALLNQSSHTRDELKQIALYSGAGSYKELFDNNSESPWAINGRDCLLSMVGEEAYNVAKSTTGTAFYTDPALAKLMWKILGDLGFESGRILSLSAGSGVFTGTQLDGHQSSEWHLCEIDPISAKVCKTLYPKAQVYNQGFETLALPDEYFDLVIDNFPFGSTKLHEKRYNHQKLSIHNHAIAKSMDKLRPGGLLCCLTTHYTMDSVSGAKFRRHLRSKADIVYFRRLPIDVHEGVGTSVSTDLIIFRKKDDSENYDLGIEWVETAKTYNYFQGRYRHLAVTQLYGNVRLASNFGRPILDEMYRGAAEAGSDELEYLAFKLNDDTTLKDYLLCEHPSGDRKPIYKRATYPKFEPGYRLIPPEAQKIADLDFVKVDGLAHQREGDLLARRKDFDEKRYDAFIELYQVLVQLLKDQQHLEDEDLIFQRASLNEKYDRFVKDYGAPTSAQNKAMFDHMASYPAIASLVNSNDQKSDIFYRSTSRPYSAPKQCKTAHEALLHCLNTLGTLNLDWIAQRVNKTSEETAKDLSQGDLAFYDPAVGEWVLKDLYLSGKVRLKLAQAIDFSVAEEQTWIHSVVRDRNIPALKQVQPLPALPDSNPQVKAEAAWVLGELKIDELDSETRSLLLNNVIQVRLGTAWIPVEVYDQFFWSLFSEEGMSPRIYSIETQYLGAPVSSFCLTASDSMKRSVNVVTKYGTPRVDAIKLAENALNQADIRIYDTIDERRVLNVEETEKARQKVMEMKTAFLKWIWSDDERSIELARIYNREYNGIRVREYDGIHLQFPGSNSDIVLRKHQRNVVWRIIQSKAVLMGHGVGAGKTIAMIAAAMELRRLGISQKPMISVLKSTIGQFEASFKNLYPQSKLLVASEKDFERENRRKFLSKIATEDWDCVLLTHGQLQRIPVSVNFQSEFVDGQIAQLEEYRKDYKNDRTATRNIDKCMKNLKGTLQRIIESADKDAVMDFELLGVDALFVDEFQVYKNLFFYTKQTNIAGLTNRASQCSMDMFMKFRYLLSSSKGRVVAATGTPITNTMSEMFTLQRYMQAEELAEMGIETFDAWSSVFGETISAPEITPTGLYKVKTRFARFCNMPELLTLFWQFADIQTGEMLKLPVPKPQYKVVSAPPSADQIDYMNVLVTRADRIANRSVKPEEDNMLRVCSDGRKSSIDPRLISSFADNFPLSKINQAALNIYKIWQESKALKATQLVFCDFSTPNPDRFNIYDYIKQVLILLGIPSEQVAFVHDSKGNKKKQTEMFDKTNRGDIRVLMGSTVKLGTGVNAQERCIAMHHIDAPWRPSDMEQREGRGIRQGNLFKKCWVFRYVTEGADQKAGFDSFLFQLLETKSRFISQVMAGTNLQRSAEDMDDAVLSYAEVKAIASGDPIIQRKTQLESDKYQLEIRRRSHGEEQASICSQLFGARKKLDVTLPAQLHCYQMAQGAISKLGLVENFFIEYNGKRVSGTAEEQMQWVHKRMDSIKDLFNRTAVRKLTDIGLIGGIFPLKYIAPMTQYSKDELMLGIPSWSEGSPVLENVDIFLNLSIYKDPEQFLDLFKKCLSSILSDRILGLESEIKDCNIKIQSLQRQDNQPFDMQHRLDEVNQELEAIYMIMREQQEAALSAEAESKKDESSDEPTWMSESVELTKNVVPTFEIIDQIRSMNVSHWDWLGPISNIVRKMTDDIDPLTVQLRTGPKLFTTKKSNVFGFHVERTTV